mgnify:CR=1 FL=1
MAIIFPSHCRNVTSGALRELKQKGATTASGGYFTPKYITNLVATDAIGYFNKVEPAGVFMDSLEQTKKHIDENTDAICAASVKLVDAAKDANKRMAEVNGKFREGTERIGNALDKLAKVVERSDFAETVRLTESLVQSLERLAVLEDRGMLDKVMKAMRTG